MAEVIGEALRAVLGIPTWRPCCPGLGRRGCLCTLPVLPALAEADGDVILSIASVTGLIAFREHAAAKAAGGRLAAALATPGVRVACIGLTSWTASRRTGSAMSSGQLGQPPPVLDPGGDRRSCGQFRQRRVRSRRRKRTGGRAARRVDRETAGTRHGRETRRLHAPSGPVDSGLKSSIRGR